MFRRRTAHLWSERHAGKWNNDNILILRWSIPLISVFDSHCRRKDWEYFSVFTHAVPYFSPGGICYVLWHLSTVPRVVWYVGLSLCLSASLTLCSLQAHMSLWYGALSRFLSTWLSVIHPPPPSVFLLSLLLSFAAVNLNTLSLEVMKQKKWLFEKLSIFSFFPPSPLHD